MKNVHWYYYLHTNGDLICKNATYMSDSDFKSDFVVKHWLVDVNQRGDGWRMILEALVLGARIDRVKELADTWKMTEEDAAEYMFRNPNPPEIEKQGLRLFFEKILNSDIEKFFDSLEERFCKKAPK